MRQGLALTIGYLLVGFGSLSAQERIALPPPDSTPGQSSGAVPDGPPIPATPPGGSTGPATTPPAWALLHKVRGRIRKAAILEWAIHLMVLRPEYMDLLLTAPRPMDRRCHIDRFFGRPGPQPAVLVWVEGLVWWSKSQPLSPPVITTGPASEGLTPALGSLARSISMDLSTSALREVCGYTRAAGWSRRIPSALMAASSSWASRAVALVLMMVRAAATPC